MHKYVFFNVQDEAAAITKIKVSTRERPGLSTGEGGKTN